MTTCTLSAWQTFNGVGQPAGRSGIALQRHVVRLDNGQRGDLQAGSLGRFDELGLHFRPAQPHLVARRAQIDLHAVEPDLASHVEGRRIAPFVERPVAGADLEAAGPLAGQQWRPGEPPGQDARRLGRSDQKAAARERSSDGIPACRRSHFALCISHLNFFRFAVPNMPSAGAWGSDRD